MVLIFLLIAGAAAGFAVNRASDRRFEDEVAAIMGAGVVLACYVFLLMLPLVFFLLQYLLILAVIAGAAAALYLFLRKK